MHLNPAAFVLAIFLTTVAAWSQTTAVPQLIRDVRVFDGEQVLEHRRVHGEMTLLVRAGLTPLQALTAATSAPAVSFHLADRGWIRAGMRADMVLVDGDPTSDILATRNIVAVWKRGVRVQRRSRLR